MSAPTVTTYPRQDADGELVWACCESSIGPACQHRAYPTDEQLCILREDYRTDADDYPNDDQVEAFYSDAAADAARLVDLTVAQRQEAETFDRKERAARILADIPEDEITQDDLDWAHGTYLLWAVAWEALGKARRELGMEAA